MIAGDLTTCSRAASAVGCTIILCRLLLPPSAATAAADAAAAFADEDDAYLNIKNTAFLAQRGSSLCPAWLCRSKLTMLKAILTPIKCIRGRVRFFENLIRSRCFFCSHKMVGFHVCLLSLAAFIPKALSKLKRSHHPHSKMRRSATGALHPGLTLLFYSCYLFSSSKWDDWLASSFGIEADEDEQIDASAVTSAVTQVFWQLIMHSTDPANSYAFVRQRFNRIFCFVRGRG
jgi:hypothetical protein